MVLSPEPVSTEQQLALQSHQPVLGCAGWLPGYLLTLEYLCVITQFHNIDKLTTHNKLLRDTTHYSISGFLKLLDF